MTSAWTAPYRAAAVLSLALVAGCAHVPYVGKGPHPQVVRGRPFAPVDVLGNIWSLPVKLLLWDWRVEDHAISEHTEERLVEFLDARTLPVFEDTTVRLNQYNPFGDLKALWKNRHVAWPYRLVLGLPVTLVWDVLLPGRLFGGDHFNPFTNVVFVCSDEPSIALHEAGHAYDFATHRFKGTYALLRLVPFVDLDQEWRASTYAVRFLKESGYRQDELRAYQVLTPAFGSYVGGYLFPPIGTVAGILAGHSIGRSEARAQRHRYERLDVLDRTVGAVALSFAAHGGPSASSDGFVGMPVRATPEQPMPPSPISSADASASPVAPSPAR